MVVFQDDLPEPPPPNEDEDFEIHVAMLVGPAEAPVIHVIGKEEVPVKTMAANIIEMVFGGTVDAIVAEENLN